MPNQKAIDMLDYKKRTSPFVILDDGESLQGEVVAIKDFEKTGFNTSDLVKVLRLTLNVNVPEAGMITKHFDNGSNKWLKEIVEKDIDTGDVIKITRHGLQNKTTYSVEVISRKGGQINEKPF